MEFRVARRLREDAGGEICGKVTSWGGREGVFAYNYVVVAKYRTR